MKKRTTLAAKLDTVSNFTQTLESELASLSVMERTTIVLAVQELLVNIVEHAYAGKQGQITIETSLLENSIHIVVKDQAENAFQIPDSVATPDPLDLPESGLGIFIIYQSFDEVRYERLANGNQWEMVKIIGG